MLGFLIYDKKDVDRSSNRNFINWLIEEASVYNLTLKLITQDDDIKQLDHPDFIINRSRLYQLNISDCVQFNSTEVIKIANDKWLTYHFFKDDVKMMPTYKVKDVPHYPCVVKNRFGHGGDDVHWLEDKKDFSDDYIAQDIAGQLGKDLRVYILNNKVYASILRTNDQDFKSNYSLGGQAKLYNLSSEEHQTIQKILNKLPIMYGGIDFLFDENNQLILNEIEDPVGAKMLYNLTDLNIVQDFIKMVSEHVKRCN
jgi:glutathione synthase/RimK-type ligase-like ATP-grasp enzyme